MRYFALVFILTIFCSRAFAQKNLSFQRSDTIIGHSILSGKAITGTVVNFPFHIYAYNVDPANNYAHIQLRALSSDQKNYASKGTMAAYNIDSNKINWSTLFKEPRFIQSKKELVNVCYTKSVGYNSMSGVKQWENKKKVIYASHSLPYGLAFGSPTDPGEPVNLVFGISLEDGKDKWARAIPGKYGWDQLLPLSDSTILISASGLHCVNMTTGLGWTYNAVTGDDDYKKAIITNVAGTALGVLTGSFFFATGHDVITDMSSDVVIDSNFLYYASKEYLVKLEKASGKIVWETKLPVEITSKSDLFIDGDFLYFINHGSAKLGNRTVGKGEPYIACFTTADGKQQQLIKPQNRSYEFAWEIRQGFVFLIYDDHIDRYEPLKNTEVVTEMFSSADKDKIQATLGRHVFVMDKDSVFESLVFSDTAAIFIYTKTDNIYKVRTDLSMERITDTKNIYLREAGHKGNHVLSYDNKLLIVDPNGKAIAVINASGRKMTIRNDRLYFANGHTLHMIDLNSLIAD